MWVAVVIIIAIVFFIGAGVAYMLWERRQEERMAETGAHPDPDAPGTPGPPVGG